MEKRTVDDWVSIAWNLDHEDWAEAMERLEGMARNWERLENLPHEATLSHGFSDITRDWGASWNLNPPESDGYFTNLEDAVYYLLREEGKGLEEIRCNDIFWWGSSDSEKVTSEIELNKALEDVKNAANSESNGRYGDLLYVARKRNLRPQGIVLSKMPKKVKALFMELPERGIDICNPHDPEGKYKYVNG